MFSYWIYTSVLNKGQCLFGEILQQQWKFKDVLLHKEPTEWCTSASVCWPPPWYYIIDQGVNLQTAWDTNIWKGNFKKWILDILLTYIQRKGGWQVFFRKGRKLKNFCQVSKEVLGTSNSLGKPLYILVTWWYLPGPQSQWQQPIVSSSLSASHLKNKKTTKHPPLQNKKKKPKKKEKRQKLPLCGFNIQNHKLNVTNSEILICFC